MLALKFLTPILFPLALFLFFIAGFTNKYEVFMFSLILGTILFYILIGGVL